MQNPLTFVAHRRPTRELFEVVTELYPENPYLTHGYAAAVESAGSAVAWIVGLEREGKLVWGVPAFETTPRRFERILEIPCMNEPPDARFWPGLVAYFRRRRVTYLHVGTYGARPGRIPELPGQLSHFGRTEHVIDLTADLTAALDSHHRRSVNKGRKSGVEIERTTDPKAADEQAALFAASLDRRSRKGQAVTAPRRDLYAAFAASGVGEFYRARVNGKLVSSVLILKARTGAYYLAAGNDPEGMRCGASHLLVHEICRSLKDEGFGLLNMGHDGGDEGLARFKRGFGAAPVALETASAYLGPTWRRKLGTVRRLLREDRGRLVRALTGVVTRYVVFEADPRAIPPAAPRTDGAEFRKLSDAELRALPAISEEFTNEPSRVEAFGRNCAYGVILDGKVVHVSWLLEPDVDRRRSLRVLGLRDGEVEIGFCLTLSEYRGRGIYPFAIRELCRTAAAAGARRVLMFTHRDNTASQHGIRNAGFRQRGWSLLYVHRPLGPRAALTWRGHRWGRPTPARRGDAPSGNGT